MSTSEYPFARSRVKESRTSCMSIFGTSSEGSLSSAIGVNLTIPPKIDCTTSGLAMNLYNDGISELRCCAAARGDSLSPPNTPIQWRAAQRMVRCNRLLDRVILRIGRRRQRCLTPLFPLSFFLCYEQSFGKCWPKSATISKPSACWIPRELLVPKCCFQSFGISVKYGSPRLKLITKPPCRSPRWTTGTSKPTVMPTHLFLRNSQRCLSSLRLKSRRNVH